MGQSKTVKVTGKRGRSAATCERCQGKSKGERLCDSCFALILERRVVKELRPARKAKVWSADEQGMALLKELAPPRIRLTGKSGITISSMTADKFAAGMLSNLAKGKLMKNKRSIMAFCGITEKELERYIKIRRIPIKKQPEQDGFVRDVHAFIQAIEEKYPGTLHAASNSLKLLNEVNHDG